MSIKNGNFLSFIFSILYILELSLVYTLVNSTKLRQRVVYLIGQRVENLNQSRSLILIFNLLYPPF